MLMYTSFRWDKWKKVNVKQWRAIAVVVVILLLARWQILRVVFKWYRVTSSPLCGTFVRYYRGYPSKKSAGKSRQLCRRIAGHASIPTAFLRPFCMDLRDRRSSAGHFSVSISVHLVASIIRRAELLLYSSRSKAFSMDAPR